MRKRGLFAVVLFILILMSVSCQTGGTGQAKGNESKMALNVSEVSDEFSLEFVNPKTTLESDESVEYVVRFTNRTGDRHNILRSSKLIYLYLSKKGEEDNYAWTSTGLESEIAPNEVIEETLIVKDLAPGEYYLKAVAPFYDEDDNVDYRLQCEDLLITVK